MRFTVVLPDFSREDWGLDADAAFEVQQSGCLRVVQFDPLPDGLLHARTTKVYEAGGWIDILREFVGFVWQDDHSESTGVLVEATHVSEASAVLKEVYGAAWRSSVWNEEDAAKPR